MPTYRAPGPLEIHSCRHNEPRPANRPPFVRRKLRIRADDRPLVRMSWELSRLESPRFPLVLVAIR